MVGGEWQKGVVGEEGRGMVGGEWQKGVVGEEGRGMVGGEWQKGVMRGEGWIQRYDGAVQGPPGACAPSGCLLLLLWRCYAQGTQSHRLHSAGVKGMSDILDTHYS